MEPTAREKLMVEQKKGSLSDVIIYMIMGVFFLFILFPVFLYAVLTGAQSDTVYFGFIDAYIMIAVVCFGLGSGGFIWGIMKLKTYRKMKKKEKEIY